MLTHLLHDFSYREHLILYEPWWDAFFILLRQYIPDPISYSNIKQIQNSITFPDQIHGQLMQHVRLDISSNENKI
jgi:hypothetical protein